MRKKKKLTLNRETLRRLTDPEQMQANGGIFSLVNTFCIQYTCVACMPCVSCKSCGTGCPIPADHDN